MSLSREYREVASLNEDSTVTVEVFPVRLVSADGATAVDVEEPYSYEAARELATDLARFLGWPLLVSRAGAPLLLAPAELEKCPEQYETNEPG